MAHPPPPALAKRAGWRERYRTSWEMRDGRKAHRRDGEKIEERDNRESEEPTIMAAVGYMRFIKRQHSNTTGEGGGKQIHRAEIVRLKQARSMRETQT
jgi:hypothetical protein